jgi:hypothetical protein
MPGGGKKIEKGIVFRVTKDDDEGEGEGKKLP